MSRPKRQANSNGFYIAGDRPGKNKRMVTLFLRAVFIYLLVFMVLRLTGKRQVADLQPFDLLITLLIADLAGCAITTVSIPLAYSVVPIIALYLVQQGITYLCLKSGRLRRVVCGSPVILIADGVLQEETMRSCNYTVIDLLDQLRAKDIFDLGNVAYGILETNGSMSILQKGEYQTPTMHDLSLPADPARLSYMLVLDGRYCNDAMKAKAVDAAWVDNRLRGVGVARVQEVFFMSVSGVGEMRIQTKEKSGRKTYVLDREGKRIA